MSYEAFISPVAEFFGQGANTGTLGARRRDADGNIKMTNWDRVLGRTQEELNSAAHERLRNSELGRQYETLTGKEVGADTTRTQLGRDYRSAVDVEDATKAYLRTSNNKGRGALEGLSSDEIYTEISDLQDSNEREKQERYGGSLERARTADRRFEESILRQERAAQRSMDLQIGQMALSNRRLDNQMELAQMDQRMKMRQQDRADARADKKDRQLMIMQLMKGLSQMGASIAI